MLIATMLLILTTLPLAGAVMLATGMLTGYFSQESDEKKLTHVLQWMHVISAIAWLMLVQRSWIMADSQSSPTFSLDWLATDQLVLTFSLRSDMHGLIFSALILFFSWLAARFSSDYLHRERGYFRFHTAILLLLTAMQFICFAASVPVTVMGWELASLASYLLIAYNPARDTAADNAGAVYLVNRLGGLGWLLATGLLLVWSRPPHSLDWSGLAPALAELDQSQQIIIVSLLLLPTIVKSGQLPFSFWLPKAMDGPTPSSAISYGALMTHAGCYMLYRYQPLLDHHPELRLGLVMLGLLTAFYGSACGLIQTHVKGTLVFAGITQLGCNFVLMGSGLAELGFAHMMAHAIFRGYQFFLAPSFMAKIGDWRYTVSPPRWMATHGSFYRLCQCGFGLEPFLIKTLVGPVEAFAGDVFRFEQLVLERIVGLPARSLQTFSGLAEREEKMLAAGIQSSEDGYAISGLPGKLLQYFGGALHWFEDRLVIGGLGYELWIQARSVGKILQHGELLFAEMRYLLLIIMITLLLVN